MKIGIYILGIAIWTTASVQAMAPLVRRAAQRGVVPGKQRPFGKPVPIGAPYPGSIFIPVPAPIKPLPISPDILSPHGHVIKPKQGRKDVVFQQVSLLPLPAASKEGAESVLVLDTSLVERELSLQKMLTTYGKEIDDILNMRVMDLVEQNKRLNRGWTSSADMQEWFDIFNSQVDVLAHYVEQFEGQTCLPNDNYCKDLIELVHQLQKQLKIYLGILIQRYKALS